MSELIEKIAGKLIESSQDYLFEGNKADFDIAREQSQEIIDIVQQSQWVSVENRLPDEGTWVLAASRKQVEILFMDSHEINGAPCWLQDGDYLELVTHWQSLPKMPHLTD